MTDQPRALNELRRAFEHAGISVSEWADSQGFRRENVSAVLSGRTRGRRGEAHRIALALGLKPEAHSMAAEALRVQLQQLGTIAPRREDPPMS